MIKSDKGSVEIKGKGIDILSEWSMLTKNIYEVMSKDLPKEDVKELLDEGFKAAFLTKEEMIQRVEDKKGEFAKKIMDEIDDIIRGLHKDEDESDVSHKN